jgi:hypothetical protein
LASPLTTPNFPDYPSSHCAQSSAARTILNDIFDGVAISLDLTSSQTPGVSRHFGSFDAMKDEIVGARIWAGIHTRNADVVGVIQGKQVGNFVIHHSLKPVHGNNAHLASRGPNDDTADPMGGDGDH